MTTIFAAPMSRRDCAAQGDEKEKSMARFLFLFLLLLSAGVAARVSAAPGGSSVPKIGVVSAIGDKLYLRKIGLTVFENEAREMAIDSWRLDDLMTARVRA